jgi:hypothetical protein
MKEASGHTAPFLRLSLTVDHEIDRDIKSSKLLAEPSVLLPTPTEMGLDDEQVKVAIRTSLAPGA